MSDQSTIAAGSLPTTVEKPDVESCGIRVPDKGGVTVLGSPATPTAGDPEVHPGFTSLQRRLNFGEQGEEEDRVDVHIDEATEEDTLTKACENELQLVSLGPALRFFRNFDGSFDDLLRDMHAHSVLHELDLDLATVLCKDTKNGCNSAKGKGSHATKCVPAEEIHPLLKLVTKCVAACTESGGATGQNRASSGTPELSSPGLGTPERGSRSSSTAASAGTGSAAPKMPTSIIFDGSDSSSAAKPVYNLSSSTSAENELRRCQRRLQNAEEEIEALNATITEQGDAVRDDVLTRQRDELRAQNKRLRAQLREKDAELVASVSLSVRETEENEKLSEKCTELRGFADELTRESKELRRQMRCVTLGNTSNKPHSTTTATTTDTGTQTLSRGGHDSTVLGCCLGVAATEAYLADKNMFCFKGSSVLRLSFHTWRDQVQEKSTLRQTEELMSEMHSELEESLRERLGWDAEQRARAVRARLARQGRSTVLRDIGARHRKRVLELTEKLDGAVANEASVRAAAASERAALEKKIAGLEGTVDAWNRRLLGKQLRLRRTSQPQSDTHTVHVEPCRDACAIGYPGLTGFEDCRERKNDALTANKNCGRVDILGGSSSAGNSSGFLSRFLGRCGCGLESFSGRRFFNPAHATGWVSFWFATAHFVLWALELMRVPEPCIGGGGGARFDEDGDFWRSLQREFGGADSGNGVIL